MTLASLTKRRGQGVMLPTKRAYVQPQRNYRRLSLIKRTHARVMLPALSKRPALEEPKARQQQRGERREGNNQCTSPCMKRTETLQYIASSRPKRVELSANEGVTGCRGILVNWHENGADSSSARRLRLQNEACKHGGSGQRSGRRLTQMGGATVGGDG